MLAGLFEQIDATNIIALSSVVVAVCALGATFWHGWQSRRHDRLSVRPLLTWSENHDVTSDGVVVTYAVRNHGLGPAVIRKRFFKVAGVSIPDKGRSHAILDSVAQRALDGRCEYRLLRSGLPGVGSAMPSQTEQVIAEVLLVGQDAFTVTKLLDSLDEVDFVVEYESLYGERRSL